jgi:hypothetical protein
MPTVDCSCRGISQDCPRCFGKGEYNPKDLVKDSKNNSKVIFSYKKVTSQSNRKKTASIMKEDRIAARFSSGITNEKKLVLIDTIANNIDALSEQQIQILKGSQRSVEKISKSTVRRLSEIESKKSTMKLEIKVIQDSLTDGKKMLVSFRHVLSKKWHDYNNLSATLKLRREVSLNREQNKDDSKIKKHTKRDKKTNIQKSESKNSSSLKISKVKKSRKERHKLFKRDKTSSGNSLGDFYERDKLRKENQ